jgi:hypothetical protein
MHEFNHPVHVFSQGKGESVRVVSSLAEARDVAPVGFEKVFKPQR